jgi:hypothetical protein
MLSYHATKLFVIVDLHSGKRSVIDRVRNCVDRHMPWVKKHVVRFQLVISFAIKLTQPILIIYEVF